MTDKLYTVPEAAVELRVSESFVRREIKAGRLGCERRGRLIFISQKHIDEYRRRNDHPARPRKV